MTARNEKRSFAARPADPDGWIRGSDTRSARDRATATHSARLTIDITPELRGRIKIAAIRRGTTVSDMLRDLLAREFPDTSGDRP